MTDPKELAEQVVQRNLTAVEALRMAKESGGFAKASKENWANHGVMDAAPCVGKYKICRYRKGKLNLEFTFTRSYLWIIDDLLEPWEWHPNSDTL